MINGDWLTLEQASDLPALRLEVARTGASGVVYHNRGFSVDDPAAYKVEVIGSGDDRYVNGNVLPFLVKMADRLGLGLQLSSGAFLIRRRNTLLNGNAIANRVSIRNRYRAAQRELTVARPLWEAVRGIKAQVLDPRMVDGIVAMAARWPEVLGIAYNGGTFKDFEGVHVAPERQIVIRFWPVLFPYETQTRGLSAPLLFYIEETGHVRCENPYIGSYGLHPHVFSHGGLCLGEGEGKFDSLLASLKNLRDWWVGTDHHPASGTEWASVACTEWWQINGAAFWAYYGTESTLHTSMELGDVPPTQRMTERYQAYYPNQEVRAVPVTDDGLDIPGLSLPEFIPPSGFKAYYVEAPAVSDRSTSNVEDRTAEAHTFELTLENLAELLNDYNMDQHEEERDEDEEEGWECARCGIDLDEDQRYYCEHCGNDFCMNHYEADDYCTECWPTLMFICADCDEHHRVIDRHHCEECGDAICNNCTSWEPEREVYYCGTHFPEGVEAGEHPTPTPEAFTGIANLTRAMFQPETNRTAGYHCEAVVNENICFANATWRRIAYDNPGWLCNAHYEAIPAPRMTFTPVPATMEPTRYPVDTNWEPLPVVGGVGGGLRCCHPECIPLRTPGVYSGQIALHGGPRLWGDVEHYLGEYACEAHVPRQVPTEAEINGWHITAAAGNVPADLRAPVLDAYEPCPDGNWECEWPSHQTYLDRPEALHDLLCGTTAPWRHRLGDFGDHPQPHFVCDAHHTAILQGGYHELAAQADGVRLTNEIVDELIAEDAAVAQEEDLDAAQIIDRMAAVDTTEGN